MSLRIVGLFYLQGVIMVEVIAEIGSCHMGEFYLAKEHIRIVKECGANKAKFQLFRNLPPNIDLPYSWFPELIEYGRNIGIEVFASVFNKDAFDIVCRNCNSIKFAYSMRNSFLIDSCKDMNRYVSYSVMDNINQDVKKLYCIPIYPIPYKIDFEEIFIRFDGFSSHCLGIKQDVEAVKNGAKIIEKHFCLDNPEINCPDSKIAIGPNDLERLVRLIYTYERDY